MKLQIHTTLVIVDVAISSILNCFGDHGFHATSQPFDLRIHQALRVEADTTT